MRLVDTHCHLHDARFDADRDAVFERAWAAGVERIVTVGTNPADWPLALGLAGPRVACALGLHPHAAAVGLAGLEALLPRAVAVGEIGLDYHYDLAPREVQRAVFSAQLSLACEHSLPVIVHEREAVADVLAALDAVGPLRGVWHCFSGGPELAERVLARGFYLGFGGLVTFRRGTEAIQAAVRVCPRDRLLLETDAPYLAPEPHRGRRNEPAFLAATAGRLAVLRDEDAGELAAVAADNAARLFGL